MALHSIRMKDKPYKFVVRLPIPLRDRVREAARRYRRSMNSEIVARLHESLSGLQHEPAGHELQVSDSGALNPNLERLLKQQLSHDEQRLLDAFRHLNGEQQAALLKLLT